MPRLRMVAAISLLALLIVPALALAKVKRGTYIEVKTQTYVVTNAAATTVKSLNITCMRNGQQSGGNLITKALTITDGTFSFDGESTLRGFGNTVIRIKVTGRFGDGKIAGKITYLDSPAPCTNRSYSAKYYGVNPQG